MITPEQARAKMPSARERAASEIAWEVEGFIAQGNPDAVLVMPVDPDDHAVLAELIAYRDAGWDLEFCSGCAALSLPAVVS